MLSERTGRFVRNRIRPADNSVRSLHHHVQTPQCRSARWPIKSVLPSRTSQHHTEGHAKACWVIHTVVARSWAVSGRVNHNLQLTTICALLATNTKASCGEKLTAPSGTVPYRSCNHSSYSYSTVRYSTTRTHTSTSSRPESIRHFHQRLLYQYVYFTLQYGPCTGRTASNHETSK